MAKKFFIEDNIDDTEHRLYPCIVDDIDRVIELYDLINIDLVLLNFVSPEVDDEGKAKTTKSGKPVYSKKQRNAINEVMLMATKDENWSKWVDIYLLEDILQQFLAISQLKNKMTMMGNLSL